MDTFVPTSKKKNDSPNKSTSGAYAISKTTTAYTCVGKSKNVYAYMETTTAYASINISDAYERTDLSKWQFPGGNH